MLKKILEKFLLEVSKPARYVGGELGATIKNKKSVDVRFAFCFPDIYEIGMSHLGMKIIYNLLNKIPYIWCERAFAPWIDMEQKMRENNIKLYALESFDYISEFDIIAFTLQSELSYTNVLNMLNLSGIPVEAKDRKGLNQLVIAGGPCTCNPEPLADFVDVFFIGESEESLLKFIEEYRKCKKENVSKKEFLKKICNIDGIYVPSFYDVSYNNDGTISKIKNDIYAPEKIKKSYIKNMNKVFFPDMFVLPNIEIVHDRAQGEIFRGCIRGCRFCQAGFIYRPFREKDYNVVDEQCKIICENTGYSEVSLCSLSSSDYTQIDKLLDGMLDWSDDKKINIALPSLRVDGFSNKITSKLKSIRKSGLTFAPEAGTQRLRDVINKNVTEEELINTCKMAFDSGWNNVKLYFMIGLPTETYEDIKGIAKLAQKVVDVYYENKKVRNKKPVRVSISVASFVPKPFTPFEWVGQNSIEELEKKQEILINSITNKKIKFSSHNAGESFLEGVFARGDRRLCKVLKIAQENNLKFDSWAELFNLDKWLEIFKICKIDPKFYNQRERDTSEILPWSHLDYLISKEFLIKEYEKSKLNEISLNCREKCLNCGANDLEEGKCYARY